MRLIAITVTLSALILSGRAVGAPDGPPSPGGQSVLFISPSGEPFRSRPGEPYPVAAWFAQADADHDGKLSRTEFVADAMRFFAVLDRNHNGLIDHDDLSYYEHVIAPEILGDAGAGAANRPILKAAYVQLAQLDSGLDPDTPVDSSHDASRIDRSAPSGGPMMSGAAPYGLLNEPEPVAASDLSFSGRIRADDFRRRAEQRFDRLDRAKQGYLELAALPKTMMQEMTSPGRRRP